MRKKKFNTNAENTTYTAYMVRNKSNNKKYKEMFWKIKVLQKFCTVVVWSNCRTFLVNQI